MRDAFDKFNTQNLFMNTLIFSRDINNNMIQTWKSAPRKCSGPPMLAMHWTGSCCSAVEPLVAPGAKLKQPSKHHQPAQVD